MNRHVSAHDRARRASPSGDQVTLRSGDTTAVVVTLGGGLRTLHTGGRQLISGYDAETAVPFARGQLLVPWPNRIADGRYTFEGVAEQLAVSEPERQCAIHGLTRWCVWTVTEQTDSKAVLSYRLHPQPGYPFLLDLSVSYQLVPAGLDVAVSATNLGARVAPYGFRMHPYLWAGNGDPDSCSLELGAATMLDIDERLLPTGRREVAGTPYDFRTPTSLDGVILDHAFTDIERAPDGRIWASLRTGEEVTSLWGDASCHWWQVCTGDEATPPWRRVGVAVEPMTCPPNAFATGHDALALSPGDTSTVRWGIIDGLPHRNSPARHQPLF